MRLSKPCWTLSKGASPPPPPLQEAEGTAECEGQDSRAPEKGSWSLYGNPHTKRCALSNRPFGSCAKARECQEGHVCGRPLTPPLTPSIPPALHLQLQDPEFQQLVLVFPILDLML